MSKHNDLINETKTGGSRRVIWATLLALVVFVTWAWFAELNEVTRAPGTVVASSRTQVVQSQDGGVLEELLVREGSVVEKGELLARIDRTRATANYLEARAKVASLSATSARLRAEMLDAPIVFNDVLDDYPEMRASQLASLKSNRLALREQLRWMEVMWGLAREELVMNKPLVDSGDVSRVEVLRLERQVAELASNMANTRNEYRQESQARLSEVVQELESARQQVAQRKNVLDQTSVHAPMRGVVKNIKVTTVGGVYRAGDEVMEIVPLEDDLLIEAKVSPRDIAFLVPGYDATVKIDAYDYTIYGDLPAKLVFISADTVTDDLKQNEEAYYRVRVRTSGRQFSAAPEQTLDIQPGMTATVEIKTGRRSVMEYLTKPVIKTLSESLGER